MGIIVPVVVKAIVTAIVASSACTASLPWPLTATATEDSTACATVPRSEPLPVLNKLTPATKPVRVPVGIISPKQPRGCHRAH
eukprot:m.492054 g.492054  ORF g.492054 m.492054 type:complete len:83 (-) comp31428_c0_seq1:58-306(-)